MTNINSSTTLINADTLDIVDTSGDTTTQKWACVVIESPYNGTDEEIKRNVAYAIYAMRDCLRRGEAPFASHLLYTQFPGTGFISDDAEDCIGRDAGIEAGCSWGRKADKTVVYQDLGITKGMEYGIASAKEAGRIIEYRNLPSFDKLFNNTLIHDRKNIRI